MKNFKMIIATAHMMLSTCIVYASTGSTIKGMVFDSLTNEKIPNVIISIEGSFTVGATNNDGNFSIQSKTENPVLIFTHIAYNTKRMVYSGQSLKVLLSPKSYISDEIHILALRANEKSGSAFTNISKEELSKNNLGADLPVLLNALPSVVTTSDAGAGIGYTGIRIRGSDATRINATINGVPVNDAESNGVYWVDLPDLASSVDNIQVQRGAGLSTNGAGAFGGSINIQTDKLSSEPYAEFSGSYGSFNSIKNTLRLGTGLMKNFSVDARLSNITSDGFIDRASSDLKSFFVNAGYYDNKQSLRFVMFSGKEKTYQAWYGVNEFVADTNPTYNIAGIYTDEYGNVKFYNNQTDNYQQDYYQLIYTRSASSTLKLNVALHYTKGKGYYEEYKEDVALSSYNLPDFVDNMGNVVYVDLVRDRWLDNDFYGASFSIIKEKNKSTFTLGGAYNHYKGLHYGTLAHVPTFNFIPEDFKYYNDEANKDDAHAFFKMEYAFNDKVSAYADLQVRQIQYHFIGLDDFSLNSEQEKSLTFFNPKAGLIIKPVKDFRCYLTAAMANKEPVRDDYINSNSVNKVLPEQMLDIELGAQLQKENVSAELNFYNMQYKDQLIVTGKINDVGEYIRQNVAKSFRRGAEFSLAYKLLKDLLITGNFTYSLNEIDKFTEYIDDYDNGGQIAIEHSKTTIAFSPDMIAFAELSYRPLKNLSFSINNKYVSKQYLDNTENENRSLSSFSTQNLRIAYELKLKKIKSIQLTALINNLSDKIYFPGGYTFSYNYLAAITTENYLYPQAGRNFMVGLSVKF